MKRGLRFIMSLIMALMVSCVVGAATAPAIGAATFVAANLVHVPAGSLGKIVKCGVFLLKICSVDYVAQHD